VGIEIHYIEGNHDFLIHRVFKNSERVRVYPKSASILLGQKRFFFAHGDTVDQEDIGYRFLRGFLRSPIAKLALAVVPGVVVDQIGRTSAKKSRCRSQHLSLDRREILRKKFRSFAADRMREGHDFVVMGHCHDLDQMSFIVDGRKAQYINVGFPREHGSMLSWTPGDETIEREKLP
jgi:UDP-2,3-diacylglucosamine hydrolase